MLFGDDDTVFYVDNVLRLLETLDHTMPYILSDHIWFPTDLKGNLLPWLSAMQKLLCYSLQHRHGLSALDDLLHDASSPKGKYASLCKFIAYTRPDLKHALTTHKHMLKGCHSCMQ